MIRYREMDAAKLDALFPPMGKFPTGAYGGRSTCLHDGGSRADTGEWECSECGRRWPSYEAWGEDGHADSVAAVKGAIARDLAEVHGSSHDTDWN